MIEDENIRELKRLMRDSHKGRRLSTEEEAFLMKMQKRDQEHYGRIHREMKGEVTEEMRSFSAF